jgi:alpha-amylase
MSTAPFLENHDQPRFQSLTTDQSLVKNAMAWSFITDGVPILYYGQEQGYTGSGDPNNREAYVLKDPVNGHVDADAGECRLWLSGYETKNKPLVAHVTSLNHARKAAINASSSFLTTPVRTFLRPQPQPPTQFTPSSPHFRPHPNLLQSPTPSPSHLELEPQRPQ